MKNFAIVTLGTPALIGLVGIACYAFQTKSEAPVAAQPLTMKRTINGFDANGVQTMSRTETYAVRSDGAEIEARTSVNGGAVDVRIVMDRKAAKRIVIEGTSKSVTTYRLSEAQARQVSVQGSCSFPPGTATDKMLGITVFLRERIDDFNDQQVAIKEWLAPSLGCLAMSREDIIRRNGSVYGRQTQQVLEIVAGEPDASLFSIPQGYTERAPSEVYRVHGELGAATGKVCVNCARTGQLLDKAYLSNSVK